MIKEALQYIVGLGEAKVQDITLPDGTIQTYSDKSLQRLTKHIPMVDNAIYMPPDATDRIWIIRRSVAI